MISHQRVFIATVSEINCLEHLPLLFSRNFVELDMRVVLSISVNIEEEEKNNSQRFDNQKSTFMINVFHSHIVSLHEFK